MSERRPWRTEFDLLGAKFQSDCPRFPLLRHVLLDWPDLAHLLRLWPAGEPARESVFNVPESMQATGTDQARFQHSPGESWQIAASGGEVDEAGKPDAAEHKSLRVAKFSGQPPVMASVGETGPGRIRTCNQGIMSPLLCH